MTQSPENLHVYQRDIRPGERTSLSVLASHIGHDSVVLDLGCGSGALGQFLHNTRHCTVDGVTFNDAEASHAQTSYRRLEIADLEQADLTALFATARYDAIVCADVLEHLRRPDRILTACRHLLKPDGKLLISIPNAGYCGLLAELLQGEFRYREEGLLDNTHVRFFTRQSFMRFMAENLWALEPLDVIERQIPDSEFKTAFDQLPPAVARYMLAVPDALAYQFIGVARPNTGALTELQSATALKPAKALFTAQLYPQRDGQYHEEDKITSHGTIGNLRQIVCFALPSNQDSITRLRLDPADRPGFLHLYGLTLRRADGTTLWQWHADNDTQWALKNAPHDQIAWNMPLPTVTSAAWLLLTGDDPWVELPIPDSALAKALQAPGTRLEAEMGWPMSADYLALSGTVRKLEQKVSALESSVALWRHASSHAQDIANHLKSQAEMLGPLHDEKTHWQAAHHQLQQLQQQQQQQLAAIMGSRTYKTAQRLAHAKRQVDRLLGKNPPLPATLPPPAPPPAEALAELSSEPVQTPEPIQTPIPPIPLAPTVDIIIPVYKGFADTQRCISSVLAHARANNTAWRLIVINDASPDPELAAWLREQAQAHPNFDLLENDINLGFVGTVNRGMSVSEANDILLLNSDTEVANNWLDRLRAAAYRVPNGGTVTPFSNNATICSYPRFCEDNAIPPGYDTATLDALFAATHPGASIDVPSGVGFCMYIRRDCLRQVGLFDVERFGQGYGEENDFCQRAAQAGWRNLHALDTFVRHTGGVSFGSSKTPRELAAIKTLKTLHPGYDDEVQAFVAADPARPYREAVDMIRLSANTLPRVLAVTHSLGGGTMRHVEELAAHLQERFTYLAFIPQPNYMVQICWIAPGEGMQTFFHWPTQSEQLVDWLRQAGVVHVHYHHLLGLDLQMMRIHERLGVPYDFTAHDYYTACPQISLTTPSHTYCGELGLAQCNSCVAKRPTPSGENIEEWRLRHSNFLGEARYVLAPSRDAASRLKRYFPQANVRVAPHTDIPATQMANLPQPAPHALSEHANLRVLVLGAVSQVKGSDTLEAAAIAAAQSNAPIEFHLIGYAHRPLTTQPDASLTVHGAYKDGNLVKIIERLKPDVVWFPAQWPETYSYTLSAALLAGVPLVVPDIGAFLERVSCRPWTWVRPWQTSGDQWLAFFMQIRQNHFVTGIAPEAAPPYPGDRLTDGSAVSIYQSTYIDI